MKQNISYYNLIIEIGLLDFTGFYAKASVKDVYDI